MKVLSTNKQAKRNYEFIEKFEAGIVLEGWEVKSIKQGSVSIDGSYAYVKENEVFVKKVKVYPLMSAGKVPEDKTERDRKLLLKKNEINKIKTLLKNIGYTLVVSKLFLSNSGFIKVEVVVSKGLKKYEKRERKKEKDLKRKLEADRKYYG